jgi:hypothetical protein
MSNEVEMANIFPQIPDKTYEDIRPGQRMGLSVEGVRQFIKRQKRMKGFEFDVNVGANIDLPVQLAGTARVLLGILVQVQPKDPPNSALINYTGTMELKVNNEIIIDNVYLQLLSPDVTDEEYIFIPRPLSGSDDITLNINGIDEAKTVQVIFYYL